MAEEKPKKANEQTPVLPQKQQAAISSPPQPQAISSTPRPQALSSPPQPQAISSTPRPQALSSPPQPQAMPARSEPPALSSAATPAQLPPSAKPLPQLNEGKGLDDPHRAAILELLKATRTIAVVGASNTPGKPSHRVAFYLMSAGFDVFPVNPALKELGGRPVYPDLKAIPAGVKIDVVDIFRKPDAVLPIVEDAIAIGARAVWMQEGIVNEDAAAKANAAGLTVVMDHCIMKEHRMMKGLPAEETKGIKTP